MPSLKDIRSRIASTKNTQKITSAMKLVSAAKLRKAQHNIVALRPYAQSILTLIADISSTQKVDHPLLLQNHSEPKNVLLVVISSDRGLCGAFNSNVSKDSWKYYQEFSQKCENLDIIFIGKKAEEYFKRRGVQGVDSIHNMAKDISYQMAEEISERVIKEFTEGQYDEIRFIFNEFISAISINSVTERLLPVDIEDKCSFDQQEDTAARFPRDLAFEPAAEEILDDLLQKHFAVQVYRCLSESVAAEHGSRMTSMENATKNAGEMINGLTLTYNKLRQAAITKEIIEITSGAEAL